MKERARKIVEELARCGRVEQFVKGAAHTDTLGADLQDLCQEVYCIILSYEPEKIVDLWENGDMDYFLARIITNQLWSKTSRFHYLYRRFQKLSVDIDGMEFAESGEAIPVGVKCVGGEGVVPNYEGKRRWQEKKK